MFQHPAASSGTHPSDKVVGAKVSENIRINNNVDSDRDKKRLKTTTDFTPESLESCNEMFPKSYPTTIPPTPLTTPLAFSESNMSNVHMPFHNHNRSGVIGGPTSSRKEMSSFKSNLPNPVEDTILKYQLLNANNGGWVDPYSSVSKRFNFCVKAIDLKLKFDQAFKLMQMEEGVYDIGLDSIAKYVHDVCGYGHPIGAPKNFNGRLTPTSNSTQSLHSTPYVPNNAQNGTESNSNFISANGTSPQINRSLVNHHAQSMALETSNRSSAMNLKADSVQKNLSTSICVRAGPNSINRPNPNGTVVQDEEEDTLLAIGALSALASSPRVSDIHDNSYQSTAAPLVAAARALPHDNGEKNKITAHADVTAPLSKPNLASIHVKPTTDANFNMLRNSNLQPTRNIPIGGLMHSTLDPSPDQKSLHQKKSSNKINGHMAPNTILLAAEGAGLYKNVLSTGLGNDSNVNIASGNDSSNLDENHLPLSLSLPAASGGVGEDKSGTQPALMPILPKYHLNSSNRVPGNNMSKTLSTTPAIGGGLQGMGDISYGNLLHTKSGVNAALSPFDVTNVDSAAAFVTNQHEKHRLHHASMISGYQTGGSDPLKIENAGVDNNAVNKATSDISNNNAESKTVDSNSAGNGGLTSIIAGACECRFNASLAGCGDHFYEVQSQQVNYLKTLLREEVTANSTHRQSRIMREFSLANRKGGVNVVPASSLSPTAPLGTTSLAHCTVDVVVRRVMHSLDLNIEASEVATPGAETITYAHLYKCGVELLNHLVWYDGTPPITLQGVLVIFSENNIIYSSLRKEDPRRVAAICITILMLDATRPGKYKSPKDLLAAYPEFYQRTVTELLLLLENANLFHCALIFISPRSNKGILMSIIPKLVEGPHAKYVTGGGASRSTTDRVVIFEREGNVAPKKRDPTHGRNLSRKSFLLLTAAAMLGDDEHAEQGSFDDAQEDDEAEEKSENSDSVVKSEGFSD